MITIANKNECSGCTACMASCPRNAISMIADDNGFQYPSVNSEACIDCSICDKACPFQKPLKTPETREAYAIKHKDQEVLKNSTSGGIFTAVSDYVLNEKGIIYGAAFDDTMTVRHIRATTPEQRDAMRGSKYVQSELGDVFRQVKQDLDNEKTVLFTGTPCQISGLKNYIKGNDSRLICLDLICHGVPSPLVYREHLKLLSKKLKAKITDYKFRPKKWGWHVHKEIVYINQREYHSTPYTDLWRSLYYSRIVTRPSCNNCPFSSLDRPGDISIGDCRGIDKIAPEFGSFDGVTLAIINSEKGRKILEAVQDSILCQPLRIEDVMQPPLCRTSAPNKQSEAFFDDVQKYGYPKAIKNHYGALYPIKYYVKKILKRS